MHTARALSIFLAAGTAVGAWSADQCYRLVSQADLGGEVRALAVSGHHVLVAGERLWSVAVDDPFHPSVETDTLLPWSACGLAVDEPRAFVAGRAAGLAILQRGECFTTVDELNRSANAGAVWRDPSAEQAGAQCP